jgi:hypothetical protein
VIQPYRHKFEEQLCPRVLTVDVNDNERLSTDEYRRRIYGVQRTQSTTKNMKMELTAVKRDSSNKKFSLHTEPTLKKEESKGAEEKPEHRKVRSNTAIKIISSKSIMEAKGQRGASKDLKFFNDFTIIKEEEESMREEKGFKEIREAKAKDPKEDKPDRRIPHAKKDAPKFPIRTNASKYIDIKGGTSITPSHKYKTTHSSTIIDRTFSEGINATECTLDYADCPVKVENSVNIGIAAKPTHSSKLSASLNSYMLSNSASVGNIPKMTIEASALPKNGVQRMHTYTSMMSKKSSHSKMINSLNVTSGNIPKLNSSASTGNFKKKKSDIVMGPTWGKPNAKKSVILKARY